MTRLLLFGFLFFAASTVSAAMPAAGDGRSHYIVKRNGDPIGTLKIDFKRDGDRLVAKSDYSIKVKLLAIVLYRYDKTMVETYENGKLIAYETDIDDNGTKSRVVVKRSGDGLAITHPKGALTAPADLIPSTYWPPDTVSRTKLIDSSEGILLSVAWKPSVVEEIAIDGRNVSAKRHAMTGDLERVLWYDAATGEWLKMKLTASDDSTIEIERDWPPVWERPLL